MKELLKALQDLVEEREEKEGRHPFCGCAYCRARQVVTKYELAPNPVLQIEQMVRETELVIPKKGIKGRASGYLPLPADPHRQHPGQGYAAMIRQLHAKEFEG